MDKKQQVMPDATTDEVRPEEDRTENAGPLSIRSVAMGTLFAGLFLAFVGTGGAAGTGADEAVGELSGIESSRLVRGHLDVRDTFFTTDDVYLDVDLQRQVVTVRRRDGSDKTFLISSGTPYISDGMATPPGIYTVQNKVPMALSRQFNDARLHNWIGVYGGIGFHGLDGNGYYGYLGKRPSSHGCLRMARNEIAEMFDMIHVGAPIYVRNGETARVVAFCDPADTLGAVVIDSAMARRRGLGSDRIASLYDGTFYAAPPRLVHLAGTKIDWRIESGRKGAIPRQSIPKGLQLPPTPVLLYTD